MFSRAKFTAETDESFGDLVLRSGSDEASNQEVAERNGQDGHEQQLSLALPLHADGDDERQDDQRHRSDDPYVVFGIARLSVNLVETFLFLFLVVIIIVATCDRMRTYDRDAHLSEQVVERLAEADRVQGHGHGVGHGEDDADGAAELGAERPADHVVRAAAFDLAVGADGRH